jgi:hypothetical protein
LGAGAFGRANSLVAVAEISSVYQNPAGLGMLNYNFVSVGIHKTLPVEGFLTVGAWGNLATKDVNLGFSADNFGDQYYHETRLGLAAAKKMDKVSMGLKLSLMSNVVKEMSSRQALLGEFGIIVQPSKFISFGLHVINFTRARLYDSQVLPTFVNFGLGINPSKKVNISGQLDYPVGERPYAKFGLSYLIKDNIGLSTGVNPSVNAVHFGVNFDVKKYKFAYSVSTHPNVGLSNHLTLTWLLNGKK